MCIVHEFQGRISTTWRIIKDHYNASHQIQKSKWFFSLHLGIRVAEESSTVKYWMNKAFIHLEKRQGKISSNSEQQFPRGSMWPRQLVKSNGPTGNTHSSVEGQLSLPVESEILKAESVHEYSSTHLSRTEEQIDIPIQGVGLPGGSAVKTWPAIRETQEMQVWPLGRDDPLEKGMATHSSILGWI